MHKKIIAYDKNGSPIEFLTQWDTNQSIYFKDLGLEKAPVVHFCNSDSTIAYAVESTLSDGIVEATVPNVLLQESLKIFIYIYLYETDTKSGTTMYFAEIPVRGKPRPNDYIFEENIDGVNIVQLNSDVKILKQKIPTSAVYEDGILKFQTVVNGITVTLFQVQIT